MPRTQPASHPKILCYLRDTRPLGGVIFAVEGDPGAMAVVEADGRLTATPLYEDAGSGALTPENSDWIEYAGPVPKTLIEQLETAAIAAGNSKAVTYSGLRHRSGRVDGLKEAIAIARAALAKVEAAS